MGLLDGKVILITGAGNGLGRAHALACAREGARVVVNDLGGARDGSGADLTAAEAVVAEIHALGGEAVANGDSVTDRAGADRMVAAALQAWGRLDAVVNNAGILRDVTFRKMDETQWRLVLDVHLNGTWNVTKAAIEALIASGGGSIVNTTSYSGLIGNFGQSNYAAAKAGIYGLTRVLALELRKAGITANCVAPIAKTRMTEELAMVDADWTPEQVSPVVVFLCSELARGVTGKVFGVQGQRVHVYEMKVNDGVEKPGQEPWTPQELAARLGEISAFEAAPAAPAAAPAKAEGPHPVDLAFTHLPLAFLPDNAGDYKATIHFAIKDGPSKTLFIGDRQARVEDGLQGSPSCTIKTDTETIVGLMNSTVDAQKAFMKGKITADNMGVLMKFAMLFRFDRPASAAPAAPTAPTAQAAASAAPDPAAPRTWPIGKIYDGGYAFVEPEQVEAYAVATNDRHVAYFGPEAVAPPMFHVRLFRDLMHAIALDPELDLDMLRLVHGEHDATFHRPLRHWDLVQLRARLETVEEKSSGLVVGFRLYGFVDGALAVEARSVYFIRAAGGRSGKKDGEPAALPPPAFTRAIKVAPDQSFRYAAASRDDNPIHTDRDTARAAGLPDVILHGLCTMAMAGKSVVDVLSAGDPRFLTRLSVRFARPVLNGSTLTTLGWRTSAGADFIVKDQDGNVVISNGAAEVR